MTNVAYWMPVENPQRLLVYLLSYPDLAARENSWKAFQADPEWIQVRDASEADGKILAKPPERVFMKITDYSPSK